VAALVAGMVSGASRAARVQRLGRLVCPARAELLALGRLGQRRPRASQRLPRPSASSWLSDQLADEEPFADTADHVRADPNVDNLDATMRVADRLSNLHYAANVDLFADHPVPVTTAADGLTLQAESTRLRRTSDSTAWERAASTWDALTRPYHAAYADGDSLRRSEPERHAGGAPRRRVHGAGVTPGPCVAHCGRREPFGVSIPRRARIWAG
jgi:hypothetical protein